MFSEACKSTLNGRGITMTNLYKRNLRAGAYGDPVNAPFEVWEELYQQGETGGTGYTKEWLTCDQRFKKYLMASCSEPWEYDLATSNGWRVYEITTDIRPGQIECPEVSNGTSCDDCLLCGGTSKDAKNIAIPAINGKKVCYVEVGKSVNSVWNSWKRGNVPAIDPKIIGDYLAGGDSEDKFKSVEAWRGSSPIDGEPIVLLISGLSRIKSEQSANKKTGPMVQTFILKQNEKPTEAIKNGGDESICGKCPLRPYLVKNALESVA